MSFFGYFAKKCDHVESTLSTHTKNIKIIKTEKRYNTMTFLNSQYKKTISQFTFFIPVNFTIHSSDFMIFYNRLVVDMTVHIIDIPNKTMTK